MPKDDCVCYIQHQAPSEVDLSLLTNLTNGGRSENPFPCLMEYTATIKKYKMKAISLCVSNRFKNIGNGPLNNFLVETGLVTGLAPDDSGPEH